MSLLAQDTFTNAECKPLYDNPPAACDDVALAAGAQYAAGQLLAAVAGSGTAVNDQQTLTVTGTPTGGSAGIFWNGQFIGNLAYNSTAAQVDTLLETYFGSGNITTSGGPWPGSAIVVTFAGETGGLFQPLMTNTNSFTGGTTPVLTITHTTLGKPAGGYWTAYIDGTADPAKRVLKYPCSVDAKGLITWGNTGPASGFVTPNRGAPAYFCGVFKCSDLVGLDANAVIDLGSLINGTAFNSSFAIINIG